MLGFKPKRTNLHEKYDYPLTKTSSSAVANSRRVSLSMGYGLDCAFSP